MDRQPPDSGGSSDDASGPHPPDDPGIIGEIVNPLAEARINVHDIITSATSVAIFVDWDDREETLELTQGLF